jgi:hypothetical protein
MTKKSKIEPPLTTLQKLQLMVHGALGTPVNSSSNDPEPVVKITGEVGAQNPVSNSVELPSKI